MHHGKGLRPRVPSFSRHLEESLHRAVAFANQRKHEYATLEHLLLSLIDDEDSAGVMRACDVDLAALRTTLTNYVDNELRSLVVDDGEDAKPTSSFQRVIQRAVLHVQSSGREEVTGANVLVAIFSERESHAAYFLQEQDMTRYDAVNYIAHGIAKKAGADQPKAVKGSEDEDKPAVKTGGEALEAYCVNLNEKAKQGKVDPLIGRSAESSAASDLCRRTKNNPLLVGDPGVGKDRHRRGPGPQDRQRPSAGGLSGSTISRSTWARSGGHPLSRRFRGTAETGRQGAGDARQRHPVHRRDPHCDRRGRDLGRSHGRLQPAEAGAGLGLVALHGLHDLQGVPPAFREGPGPGPPLPEDRRQRADGRGHDQDPQGPEDLLRGPQGPYTNDAIKAAVELTSITDRKLPDKAIDIIDEAGAGECY